MNLIRRETGTKQSHGLYVLQAVRFVYNGSFSFNSLSFRHKRRQQPSSWYDGRDHVAR